MKIFAMQGDVSGELLSLDGRILVHDDKAELEFLFPFGMKVVDLPSYVKLNEQMSIKQHPELASVRWPLKRSDFKTG